MEAMDRRIDKLTKAVEEMMGGHAQPKAPAEQPKVPAEQPKTPEDNGVRQF